MYRGLAEHDWMNGWQCSDMMMMIQFHSLRWLILLTTAKELVKLECFLLYICKTLVCNLFSKIKLLQLNVRNMGGEKFVNHPKVFFRLDFFASALLCARQFSIIDEKTLPLRPTIALYVLIFLRMVIDHQQSITSSWFLQKSSIVTPWSPQSWTRKRNVIIQYQKITERSLLLLNFFVWMIPSRHRFLGQ